MKVLNNRIKAAIKIKNSDKLPPTPPAVSNHRYDSIDGIKKKRKIKSKKNKAVFFSRNKGMPVIKVNNATTIENNGSSSLGLDSEETPIARKRHLPRRRLSSFNKESKHTFRVKGRDKSKKVKL